MTYRISALAGPRRVAFFVCLAAAFHAAQAQDTKPSGWVVIPISEYSGLRAKALPATREAEPPLVQAGLTRIEYDLKVEGELATGRATLTVDVPGAGWVGVPIPAGLMVREARLDGRPVSLTGQPLAAVFSKPGRSALVLDFALPVATAAGEERVSIPATASGVTRVALAVARPDLAVKVSGGLLADERSESEAGSRWVAYARGNEPLVFAWRRKIEERVAPVALRFRGGLTSVVSLAEESTSVYAEVNLEIVQGAAQQVRIALPPSVTVNQVPGANVADWQSKPGELLVSFLDPVEQGTSFVIQAEAPVSADGSVEIPILRLLDAERESGGVAVEVLGAGEIRNLRSQGLERVEAAELGAAIATRQSPSMAAFRFRAGSSAARTLSVDVARYTQQAVLTANIEEARYRVLMSAEGKTLIEARYAVRSTQRSFLRITLPAGSTVWSASLGSRPARPGRTPDGGLLFPLEKGRAGEDAPVYAVEVIFLSPSSVWRDRGKVPLALPAVDLPISKTGLVLYHPPQFRVALEPGGFRAQPFERPGSPVLANAAPALGATVPAVVNNVQSTSQVLADRYRLRNEARRPPPAGLTIQFPVVGPSLYFASELTAEKQAPTLELNYQKETKGGVR